MTKAIKTVFIGLMFSFSPLVGHAFDITDPFKGGGVIGNGVEIFCGGCGVGRAGDKVHEQFKNANPDYADWEEKQTNDFRESVGLERHCEPLFDKRGRQVGCQ